MLLAAFFLMNLPLTGPVAPPPTAGHVLVYSKALSGVLLLHGETDGPPRLWLFKGTTWSDLGALGTTPRSLPACAYDPKRRLLLVHGGALPTTTAGDSINWKADGQTLGWNGKTWRVLATTGPSARDHHAMVYDRARKTIVLFGGGDADPSGRSDFFGDTWEFADGVWKRVGPPEPSP